MPLAAYYNMDMKALEVEAGFLIAEDLVGKDNIKRGKIKGEKFAVTLHIGSYDSMEPAYEALSDHVINSRLLKPVGLLMNII